MQLSGLQGFITAAEFLSIPELSINPLAKRLAYFFESINFKEFVAMLAPYSTSASQDDKLLHMFQVHDVDGELPCSAA
jgi:serine/threonine-protein phosphatase 2B regulatory subunit